MVKIQMLTLEQQALEVFQTEALKQANVYFATESADHDDSDPLHYFQSTAQIKATKLSETPATYQEIIHKIIACDEYVYKLEIKLGKQIIIGDIRFDMERGSCEICDSFLGGRGFDLIKEELTTAKFETFLIKGESDATTHQETDNS